MNLSQLYSQIQKNETSLILIKKYGSGVLKDAVEKEEEKFRNQGISLSLEVPVIEEKGIWFKVNLSQNEKSFPIIHQDTDFHGDKYYSSEYNWKASTENKGFIFNKPIRKEETEKRNDE